MKGRIQALRSFLLSFLFAATTGAQAADATASALMQPMN
jgi:hypothetical protein